jgi:hypothetical protein
VRNRLPLSAATALSLCEFCLVDSTGETCLVLKVLSRAEINPFSASALFMLAPAEHGSRSLTERKDRKKRRYVSMETNRRTNKRNYACR